MLAEPPANHNIARLEKNATQMTRMQPRRQHLWQLTAHHADVAAYVVIAGGVVVLAAGGMPGAGILPG